MPSWFLADLLQRLERFGLNLPGPYPHRWAHPEGKFSLHRKTRRSRPQTKLREVKVTLRRRQHAAIDEQGAWPRQVVTGYFAYHAVPTNIRALEGFRRGVRWLWWRSL